MLIIGPGLDDGTRTKKLADVLAARFRVVRLHRRQYRMDLKTSGPCSIADEVDDVLAVATAVGEPGEVTTKARAAIAAGKTRHRPHDLHAGHRRPATVAGPVGTLSSLVPHYRELVPAQIDDLEALDRLGVRLDTYAQVTVPTLLLGGDRSPAHLTERLDAIEHMMPQAEKVVMHNRDHGADLKAPKLLAGIIETFADKVLNHPE